MIGIKDQCFGVEIELTGITRAEAAEALGAYFETTPQRSYDNYDSWYVPDREGKQWRIMSDGSIRAEWNDDGHYRRTTDPEYRVEMVTPKLTYDEMEKFQECVRRIRQAGGKVNDSCGMHVHVDASNHNRQSLKNLLSIMYSKEDLLFKALKTDPARVNRWCQRVREPMLQRARRLSNEPTRDLTQLENIWYEGCISAHEHYNWTRYYALNLHSVFYRGTIEWRCFNSTLHAGRAKAYVNLCLAMSAQAIAQRTSVMRKTVSDNELFTFRVWLVRMGLNGDEFKNTRDRRDDRAGGVSCKVGAVAANLAPALDTLGFQADIHAVEMVNVAGRGVGERNFQRLRAGVDRNFFNLHLESLTSKILG